MSCTTYNAIDAEILTYLIINFSTYQTFKVHNIIKIEIRYKTSGYIVNPMASQLKSCVFTFSFVNFNLQKRFSAFNIRNLTQGIISYDVEKDSRDAIVICFIIFLIHSEFTRTINVYLLKWDRICNRNYFLNILSTRVSNAYKWKSLFYSTILRFYL